MKLNLGLLSLVLAACATDERTPSSDLFGVGNPDEQRLAEDRSYDVLFSDGVADAKGIDGLRTERVVVDDLATAHTRVRQLVGDVPVWGGEAIVHLDAKGDFAGITDDLVPDVYVDTHPEYTADEAIDIAVELDGRGWGALSDDPTADLWVIRQDGVDHLAWRVQLEQIQLDAGDAKPVLFVDAHDGSFVWGYDNFQTASASCTGTTNYYGSVAFDCYTDGTYYYAEDPIEVLGAFTWNNTTTSLYYVDSASTTFPTDAITVDAIEALYASELVNDYYWNVHGRNGIDGVGGPAGVTTHGYGYISSTTSYSRRYNNAYWNSSYMTYGDGDGTNFSSLTTIDIAGHEMSHGVTENEANLTYSGEPGGLNEAMSDIMGTCVEFYSGSGNWTVGEDAYTPGVSGDALRYMDDPAADGYSLDYYSTSAGSTDVHYSSGIANLAFYLLSEGGTHPRGKSTTVVTGIGIDAAQRIFYRALTTYMTSSTSFSGARTATISAATDLYGATSNEVTQVQNAWSAVGVNAASASTCATSAYSGSITKSGRSAYAPSSSGASVTIADQTVSLTGTATNFDLYLEKKSGRSWSTVASSTGSSSTESLSYTGTSGTYRVRVYSRSGTGSYSVSWCK